MQEGQLAKTALLALGGSGDTPYSFKTYQIREYKRPKTMFPATWNPCPPRTNKNLGPSAMQNFILWL